MNNKEILVFRIEYEKIPQMSSWIAFVAAHNIEEAERYINRLYGPIRTLSGGMQCRLDALSFEVREKIVNAYMGRSSTATIEEIKTPKTPKTPKKR